MQDIGQSSSRLTLVELRMAKVEWISARTQSGQSPPPINLNFWNRENQFPNINPCVSLLANSVMSENIGASVQLPTIE